MYYAVAVGFLSLFAASHRRKVVRVSSVRKVVVNPEHNTSLVDFVTSVVERRRLLKAQQKWMDPTKKCSRPRFKEVKDDQGCDDVLVAARQWRSFLNLSLFVQYLMFFFVDVLVCYIMGDFGIVEVNHCLIIFESIFYRVCHEAARKPV